MIHPQQVQADRGQSDFFIYRIFVARSKQLWGDKVHVFFQFVGIAIIVVGVLMAIGRL